jgi:hypothetical protein
MTATHTASTQQGRKPLDLLLSCEQAHPYIPMGLPDVVSGKEITART